MLESEATLGGVWSRGRLYPGLRTNNVLGAYEFPDFPMDATAAACGVQPGEHIPGAVVHEYLVKYAEHFGVDRRIRFCTRVESAEQDSTAGTGTDPDVDSGPEHGGWVLAVRSLDTDMSKRIRARRLIVATGLTSSANLPSFAGAANFPQPLFHIKDFARRADLLHTTHTVAVLGGAKSAWDAAHAFASAGVRVELIVRASGAGPVWMSPARVTPLGKLLERLVHTRVLTWFSPCVWGDEDGYGAVRRFLHGTALGRAVVRAFWRVLEGDLRARVRYGDHPETAKLTPWHAPFWSGSALSILNYPTDFFEFVRDGMVRVHVADVTYLSEREGGSVHLSTGDALRVDALVCATGWKARPPTDFLPPGMDATLGLPHYAPFGEPDALALKADKLILERFPALRDQPAVRPAPSPASPMAQSQSPSQSQSSSPPQPQPQSPSPSQPKSESAPDPNHNPDPNLDSHGANQLQPFRLYRFIVPPAALPARNLAFAGMLTSVGTAMCAAVQALWISAFFDGALDRRAPAPGSELERELEPEPEHDDAGESEAGEERNGEDRDSKEREKENNRDRAKEKEKEKEETEMKARCAASAALHAQYLRWRYPYGRGAPDFVFDAVPYLDMLLRDLGLEHRRKRGWGGLREVREVFEAYGPRDYAGLVGEWVSAWEGREGGGGGYVGWPRAYR